MDDITFTAATKSTNGLTSSAILGPFWRQDTPHRENGTTITFDTPSDGQVVYMHGKVTDVETGKPLQNATVDVWQASTNGKILTTVATRQHLLNYYRPLRATRFQPGRTQPPRSLPHRR